MFRRQDFTRFVVFVLLLAGAQSAAWATVPTVSTMPAGTAGPASFGDLHGLSPKVLDQALAALACAKARGVSGRDDVLTVIDYSLPSTAERLWVIDLAHRRVLYHELVAHGSGSGEVFATRFSNSESSHQTSLGLFRTGDIYEGGKGYSLRLHGLDAGVNDRALERNIVIHGAWYVSPAQARQYGRIGRSWGCPALPQAVAHRVIDTIAGGTFVYAYAQDPTWLRVASASCGALAPSPTFGSR